MLSSILRAAGYRVGLYSSPHLHHLGERVAVGSSHLTAAEMHALVQQHEALIRRHQQEESGKLSHFEVLTALAFRCSNVGMGPAHPSCTSMIG